VKKLKIIKEKKKGPFMVGVSKKRKKDFRTFFGLFFYKYHLNEKI
jgi:hypothetical protein